MLIVASVIVGAAIWAVFVRPWQRKQYEKELRRRLDG